MDTPTKELVINPSDPTTHARFSARYATFWRVVWLAITVWAVGMTIAGIPSRYAELLPPCDQAAPCITSQFSSAEQAALNSIGVTMSQYVIFFEVVALLFVVVCTVIASIIFWRRTNSQIAFVASLFLIVISCLATFNSDALARANPVVFALPWRGLGAVASIFAAMLFYQFPNGRFVPTWTRWMVLVWSVYLIAAAVFPSIEESINAVAPRLADLVEGLILFGGIMCQIYRYVKVATATERQQVKWIVMVIAINLIVWILSIVVAIVAPPANPLVSVYTDAGLFLAYVISFVLIPIGFIVSILRYRLWDIDFIINRSLIYGALTVLLIAVFLVTALILQEVATRLTGTQNAAIVVGGSMLVAGLLFTPARDHLRRFVDKRLYGIQINYVRALKDQNLIPTADKAGMIRPIKLDDYGKLDLLGRGGMADVYKGMHPTLERPVAIKVLRPLPDSVSADYSRRFEREARILAQLKHPNIIQLYDFGASEDGLLYMVIEYIQGTDLARALQQGEVFSLDETVGVLKDIAAALDHAHALGTVHRDIKPSNIMLEPRTQSGDKRRFRAVLTDFGIAKMSAATQLTASNLMGTFDYIAPEQIRDSADVDGRADVYSLGVVAYQMLTGERPFTAQNAAAMLIAHLNTPAPDPRAAKPSLSEDVALTILRAMSKDPLERYATAGEMTAAMAV